jgi:transposase
MNKKYIVELPDTDREYLLEFIAQGQARAREFTRAHILLKAAEGLNDEEIALALHSTLPTVQRVRQRYVEEGLTRALKAKPHAARAKKFEGSGEALIIATACSPVPNGHGHWTLRMLADKAVELELAESVSPETIRQLLKKVQ